MIAACLRRVTGVVLLLASATAAAQDRARDPHAAARQALIAQLRAEARAPGDIARLEPRVLDAMARVPRHRFVPADQQTHAYEDRPLAIGHGQTISQPYIVALMTSLLQPARGHKVLEVGTGSGYQAAVLAELGAQVYTIEILEPLGRQAASVLKAYPDVRTRIGDGYRGWAEQAPFDAIIVTAAVTPIPPPLLEQLRPGGRMVIPVGRQWANQTLMLVEKDAAGRVRERRIAAVRFVPLTGERD